MPREGSVWTDPAFLFTAFEAMHDVASRNGTLNQEQKQQVEEYIKARGYSVTWNAIRQHLQKLRKTRPEGITTPVKSEGTPTKKGRVTPASSKKGTPRKKKTTPVEAEQHDDDDDEDDDDEKKVDLKRENSATSATEEETPTKKKVKKEESQPV